MRSIELVVSEAIKNGKWIDIAYKNNRKETTYYWIAIKDIDLKSKILSVDIFNSQKSLYSLEAMIKFEQILSAKILEFTTYETPQELIEKIETHPLEAEWLKYETFNHHILRYYLKCNELDNDPYQKDSFLIPGIDKDVLLKKKRIMLNEEQEKQVLRYIKKYDGKNQSSLCNHLILSFLSIDEYDKKYVVLYYEVAFNPRSKVLSILENPRINYSFLIHNKKHSLSSYIDMDPEVFIEHITKHLDSYLEEYSSLIRANLRDSEMLNQMPEFMILERAIQANLAPTYSIIEEKMATGHLERPLKAFFGNTNRFGAKRKELPIIIYDNKVNIDQMRVIYNTMKYPITYVQGPPGTGKTQTILNVVLSAFFHSKTTLICSSNNKPIDGILKKLSFSNLNHQEIVFPYLRLGNVREVLKSTKRILDLYHYETTLEPDEKKLSYIKAITSQGNQSLVKSLEIYEHKKELEDRIESASLLASSIQNPSSRVYQTVLEELQKLKMEYQNLPRISNSDVLSLVHSVSDDPLFKQYLFFESLRYIKKLKNPRFDELISICKIENEESRVSRFNKWCSDDAHIKLLESVFPIIITTNISSSRLGSANHTFDLVIMDEAGQCNCATALLPIARAKQLLLVGDTNQLKPVIVLEDIINETLKEEYGISDDYDYKKNSILDIMRNHDHISKEIMLSYHYRCGKKIINFSNQRFYENQLNLDFLKEEGNLSFINVENMNSRYKNENYEEAKAIVEYVRRNQLDDAAIITPFKNQQNLINSMLKEQHIDGITCGTIHQVQGDEKNTIIISTSISPKTSKKTFDWIKNNSEITNVAVTRAKKNLIVVADQEALENLSTDKKDDLYNLVKYIKNNGNTEVAPSESCVIQIGKSNGSKNEDFFYKTISHFCSVYPIFQAKRNVAFSTIFASDPLLCQTKYEFDAVLYQIQGTDLIPKIAIELQGGEHFGDINRERCDRRKSEVCKEKGIILLEIPNSYAKSYETVKALLFMSCGEKIEQLELF